jgi:hypothetical protein
MQTLKPRQRLGLVLHPSRDPTQVVEALEVRLRPRAGLVVRLDPERYQRRSGVKLSLMDLPFLPDEMRDVLPDGDPVALTLDA